MPARHRDDESCGMTGTSHHPEGMTARVAKRTAAAPNEPLGCIGMSSPRGRRLEIHRWVVAEVDAR
jgi:hypothetical protein